MKPTDQQEEFERIEDYLAGRLTRKQVLVFEKQLADDPEFKKEVEEIRLAQDKLQQVFAEEEILKTIRSFQKNERIKQSGLRRFTIIRYAGTFAAAASLLFALYVSFSTIEFPDTENDFNITRGVDTTNFTPEQRTAFSSFFDGQAHLVEGLYLLAVSDFESSLKVGNVRPYFREAAQWHLSVAYMKSGQAEKAEAIYNTFSECVSCEYPVSQINRWKLWWQIQLSKI